RGLPMQRLDLLKPARSESSRQPACPTPFTPFASSSRTPLSQPRPSNWQASFQYSRRFANLCCVVSDSTNKPPRRIARFTSRRVQLARAVRHGFSLSAHHPIGIWVERIDLPPPRNHNGRPQRLRLSAKIEVVATKLVRERETARNGIRNVVVRARPMVNA